MTQQLPDLATLAQRLDQLEHRNQHLERQIRRGKIVGRSAVLLCLLIVTAGAARDNLLSGGQFTLLHRLPQGKPTVILQNDEASSNPEMIFFDASHTERIELGVLDEGEGERTSLSCLRVKDEEGKDVIRLEVRNGEPSITFRLRGTWTELAR
jgi:hypothetical protein